MSGTIQRRIDFNKIIVMLKENFKLVGISTCITTVVAIIYCLFATPIFTAKVFINPPKLADAGTSFSQVLSGLGPFSGGGFLQQRTDGDIMIAMMRTSVVQDMIIKKFDLIHLFKLQDIELTRGALSGIVKFIIDMKSGFVEVDVNSSDPKLAANIANYYTVALGQAINNVAYAKANQRYKFYQTQLKSAVKSLGEAESALRVFAEQNGILAGQQSQVIAGISSQLQAQLVNAQMQLQNLVYYVNKDSPDYKAAQVKVESLKNQLDQLNNQNIDDNIAIPAGLAPTRASQYVTLMRDFTFKQLVYEVMLKQSKAAQLDAQSELVPLAIQVVDPAQVPLYKSAPKRLNIIFKWAMLGLFGSCIFLIIRHRKKFIIEVVS